MQVKMTLEQLTETILALDCLIDFEGITLFNCQLICDLLLQEIWELEKTDQHSAIRQAYAMIDEYLKYLNDLRESEPA